MLWSWLRPFPIENNSIETGIFYLFQIWYWIVAFRLKSPRLTERDTGGISIYSPGDNALLPHRLKEIPPAGTDDKDIPGVLKGGKESSLPLQDAGLRGLTIVGGQR